MKDGQHPDLEALAHLSQKLARAAESAAKALSDTLIPAIQKAQPGINRLAKVVEAAAWAAYGRAGMPYGESQEGLIRWLNSAD